MEIQQCLEILDLEPELTAEKLNQTYRDLVAVWHPDRFSNNPRLKQKAEEKLKLINEAYNNLLAYLASESILRTKVPESGDKAGFFHSSRSAGTPRKASKITSLFLSGTETISASSRHPWLRFLSRIVDYLIFFGVLKLLGANIIFSKFDIPIVIYPAFLASAWVIPEASILSIFGTTPGKWLLGASVRDTFQLKPRFFNVLRRSLSVWCNGMGMGIPFVAPVTMSIAYFKLKRNGQAVWDRDRGLSVAYKKIGIMRSLFVFLSSSIFIFYLVLDPTIMLKILKQAVRLNPDDPNIYYNLGTSYVKLGRYNEAIEAFKKAANITPDHGQAHHGLGISYIKLGQYEKAMASFKEALNINPENAQAHYYLGICFSRLHQHEYALKALSQAIKIKPDYEQAFHELCSCYIELEHYDKAMEACKRVLEINPDHAEALNNLGIIYSALQLSEEAIECLNKAVTIRPEYAQAHYNLGICQVELARYVEAIDSLKNAIRIHPDYAEAYYSLGICHAKMRQTEDAVNALKHSIRIKPDYAQAYHILGLAYLTLGEKDSALKQHEILKTLDKDLAEELLFYIEGTNISNES